MDKGEMLYEGKAKQVYATGEPEQVIVVYKDDATAFNGAKRGAITGKGALNGVDALYAIVQMPQGMPVATVAIDGAYNAGLLAAQILAVEDAALTERLAAHRRQLAERVEERDRRLQEMGVAAFLEKR